MRYLLLTFLLFLSHLTFGQFQKIINQSFETKNITKVDVELEGNVSYQEWEGMFLLVETKVVIENCNDNIFKSFIAAGRYLIDYDIDGEVIKLKSNKSLGSVVHSNLGETVEKAHFTVYFPKGFKDSSGRPLVSTIKHEQVSDSK